MKYLAILRQDGGCDYTIGCGINTIIFEAENVLEASKKLQEIVKENYSSEEYRLKSANMYEIKSTYEVDVDLWYSKLDQAKAIEKQNAVVASELAELERLKKKYNK